MDENNEARDEDVVVIEERDKRTYLYIVIASILSLALGGLVGSSLTAKKWQAHYDVVEQKYRSMVADQKAMAHKVKEKVADVDHEVKVKLESAIKENDTKHADIIKKLEQQIKELEKVNTSLEEKVTNQIDRLASAQKENTKLNRQADMQASMFERSREIFQKEFRVKQELDALEKERDSLQPRLQKLKKACDDYLSGTSWEAKSDSCDKQDESQSRLSQVEQMIRVHQMDLKQMKALSQNLGL